jgi:hypothetical protein
MASRPDQPGQTKKCHKAETSHGRQCRETDEKPQVSGERYVTWRENLQVVVGSHATWRNLTLDGGQMADPPPT